MIQAARGDAREDSDYDAAVFLKDLTDRWHELDHLADLGTDILDETGGFIHAMLADDRPDEAARAVLAPAGKSISFSESKRCAIQQIAHVEFSWLRQQ